MRPLNRSQMIAKARVLLGSDIAAYSMDTKDLLKQMANKMEKDAALIRQLGRGGQVAPAKEKVR